MQLHIQCKPNEVLLLGNTPLDVSRIRSHFRNYFHHLVGNLHKAFQKEVDLSGWKLQQSAPLANQFNTTRYLFPLLTIP